MKNWKTYFTAFILGQTPTLLMAQSEPAPSLVLNEVTPVTETQLKTIPKNIARWHMGAKLFKIDPKGNPIAIQAGVKSLNPEGNLLGDDEAQPCSLPQGKTEFILDLSQYFQLESFNLKSFTATGSMSLSMSSSMDGSQSWKPLFKEQPIEPNQDAKIGFPTTDARYLKISFDLTKPGSISNFGLMGRPNQSEVSFNADAINPEAAYAENVTLIEFDFGSLHSGAQITHVSSGAVDLAQAMIDDNAMTSFSFEKGDSTPILILRLNKPSKIDRISCLITSGDGQLDAYFLNAMPDFESLPSQGADNSPSLLQIPASFFENNPASISLLASAGNNNLMAELESTKFQILLLRWKGDPEAPLQFNEISVMGQIPEELARLGYLSDYEFFEAESPETPVIPNVSLPADLPTVTPQ
jgi:hypothetical protein